MTLPMTWATSEDFATLFQYFWYSDFPIDQSGTGARRSDWTIHTGVVVHNIAKLMGFVVRYESGHRKDAVLRSADGDEIAVEWEWDGVFGNANELSKLKDHKIWPGSKKSLKYAVLITYTHTENVQSVYERVETEWGADAGTRWPLLLILIDIKDVSKSEYFTGKEFQNIQISYFSDGKKVERKEIRSGPAFPWKVTGTRMSVNWSKE